MKTAAVTDLKNRLSHYLRLVARGETVTVLDREYGYTCSATTLDVGPYRYTREAGGER